MMSGLPDFPLLLAAALVLDCLVGDPRWLPHPVRLIAWWAWRVETFTRRLCPRASWAGCITVVLVLAGVALATLALLLGARRLHPAAGTVVALLLLYSGMALRDLLVHARRVLAALREGEGAGVRLDRARRAVAMMVGRDTATLDEAGVVRACVESLAENLSDGVVAPLCWATAGALAAAAFAIPAVVGAVLALMLYKAVNTMDSLFGYKNERYLHFGRCPARLDDLANLLPARLSALALILAAPLVGGSPFAAWHIWRRDHGRHASPNAGHPEAALAGALGIRLGGPASYFGQWHDKACIGDERVALGPSHINTACRLVFLAALLVALVCLALGCYTH